MNELVKRNSTDVFSTWQQGGSFIGNLSQPSSYGWLIMVALIVAVAVYIRNR